MADAAAKKGSVLGTVAPLLILTLLAGGGGAFVGRAIMAAARAAVEKTAAGPEAAKDAAAAKADNRVLKELAPVVTNLASPEGSWIRLQAAIVYDKADAPAMDMVAPKIDEDILAFIRTLTLTQIQGASGLDALRDDLNERAAVRSEGKVRELLIEALVVK